MLIPQYPKWFVSVLKNQNSSPNREKTRVIFLEQYNISSRNVKTNNNNYSLKHQKSEGQKSVGKIQYVKIKNKYIYKMRDYWPFSFTSKRFFANNYYFTVFYKSMATQTVPHTVYKNSLNSCGVSYIM